MAGRECVQCGEAMPLLCRSDAVTCSPRCRQARSRARRRISTVEIPGDLLRTPRWVRRSAAKVPLTVSGRAASSTDRATWVSHDRAGRSEVGVGLGFVLSSDDDIVCVDLDHCLDGAGGPLPWARVLLAQARGTWVERSVSGDGLHIWGRAPFQGGRKRAPVEVYGSGRYIAVTGQRFGRAPARLADITDLIDSVT